MPGTKSEADIFTRGGLIHAWHNMSHLGQLLRPFVTRDDAFQNLREYIFKLVKEAQSTVSYL